MRSEGHAPISANGKVSTECAQVSTARDDHTSVFAGAPCYFSCQCVSRCGYSIDVRLISNGFAGNLREGMTISNGNFTPVVSRRTSFLVGVSTVGDNCTPATIVAHRASFVDDVSVPTGARSQSNNVVQTLKINYFQSR